MTRMLIVLIVLGVLVEFYCWQTVRLATDNKWVRRIYLFVSAAVVIFFFINIIRFDRAAGINRIFMVSFGLLVLILVPKLLVSILMFLSDLIRWGGGIVRRIADKTEVPFSPDRRRVTAQIILAMAAIPFSTIIYGLLKGKFNFKVMKETLYFDDLPDDFDGFKILQLSDIHVGSFANRSRVQDGIDLINEQEYDMMVFTGDLVNSRATEMDGWYDVFSQMRTPESGKYAVLGNHDYGEYLEWPSQKAKEENLEAVKGLFPELGFRLLLNENVKIRKNNSEIALIGVENWGVKFQQFGDLEKASEGVSPEAFKILLTHDPTHWDEKVRFNPKKYDLTMAGHTHGMQFGVEIPGWIKWSPSKYIYPQWAGLYEESKRFLYVNRGFGFLGFPGRVGMWPEITVLELRKSNA